jgi:hypothetical protein
LREDVKNAVFDVNRGFTFVGVAKGSGSCGVSVTSDPLSSSSAARVDDELQGNAEEDATIKSEVVMGEEDPPEG